MAVVGDSTIDLGHYLTAEATKKKMLQDLAFLMSESPLSDYHSAAGVI